MTRFENRFVHPRKRRKESDHYRYVDRTNTFQIDSQEERIKGRIDRRSNGVTRHSLIHANEGLVS